MYEFTCLAWWHLSFPKTSLVPFSHLTPASFKKCKSSKNHKGYYWSILSHRIKREKILSLCSPQKLFQAFNRKPIQKQCLFRTFFFFSDEMEKLSKKRKKLGTIISQQSVFVSTIVSVIQENGPFLKIAIDLATLSIFSQMMETLIIVRFTYDSVSSD